MSTNVSSEKKVYKKVLANGLTVLVRSNHVIPKVSTQLWYNVGSKDEKSGEKGIAHLIEHMIFKGTKNLSESDINMITQKLSGSCNAFTSYDYTGYLFDFPTHHWHEALPIMAECMTNCLFKEDFLASEMKAVIQELKMYRDDYASSLAQEMISIIFIDHPYHYPIIGFKQDLWSLKREALVNFYKKHYVPNNATLVVVGDVDKEEVFAAAEKNFGAIAAHPAYKKEAFYFGSDIISKSVTLHRDVQQPMVMFSWVIPGERNKMDYFFDIFAWILGLGKGSRLYRLLVDELQLATDIETFSYDLFDHSLFFIYVQPKRIEDIDKIIELINVEIAAMIKKGLSDDELQRAIKQTQAQYLSMLEHNQKQAYVIGQSYVATGDENFLFNYLDHPVDEVKTKIYELLRTYFRPSLMHKGFVVPLSESDKEYWKLVQEQSDKEDERILSNVKRETPVEKGEHVHQIKIAKPKGFTFPRAKKMTLSNGIKVLSYHNPNVPKIELVASLPGKYFYDPDNLQGLNAFMTAMMMEGTKNYTAAKFADAIESRGMSLDIVPGQIVMSMMSDDLPIALELLLEVLTHATFEKTSLQKVREQLVSDLKDYWDDPSSFIGQLVSEHIYKNHPYSKKILGDFASLKAIQRDDIKDAYKKYITPHGVVVALVGDIERYDLGKLLEKTFGVWQGPVIEPMVFPELKPMVARDINYPINRDQVVLGYAGLSISRLHKNFDEILLFDQIFAGGVLGSMASRLFELREQSGLFYTIGGSLLSHTDEQPGMIFIKTIVSLDRLQEAEKALQETIDSAADYIHDYELQEAKNAVANSLVDNFASNRSIAVTMLFLDRFNFPEDYFDHRATNLFKVSAASIQAAVKALLSTKTLLKIRIGRV